MLYFKIAWRNIWRNKRRTLITISSITVAVALAIFMRSQQEGSYENMIENTAGSFIGYLQIHQKGYWEEQNLDNTFEEDSLLEQTLTKQNNIEAIVPRLDYYALLAGQEKSRAGLIVGIDPFRESALSNPESKLIEGSYFNDTEESAALVAEGLANFLDLKVGDSIVVIGQGYQEQSAVGKYPIKGIFKFPTPEQNKSLMYLPLRSTQELFSAYGLLTSYNLVLDQPRKVPQIKDKLVAQLDKEKYEIMTWAEITPELEQLIVSDRIGGVITIGILYLLVGFGIFGTIIMMTTERRYEFGVLLGIGMSRLSLGGTIFIETICLALLGIGVGITLISPLVWYFHHNPIKITGEMAKATEEMGLEPIIVYSQNPGIFLE
ncbi:MAG: ABC transporter permease, partial [Bacteroidota bacterium]